MLLYDHPQAPNPWRVRIFLAEKGVTVPSVEVDLMGGQSRQPAFLAKNSLGEAPLLELDDGRVLTESVAISRYIESLHPDPPLFGRDVTEQAFVEMWNRRIEQQLMEVIGAFARHTFAFFADKVDQNAAFAASQLKLMQEKWAWLDGEMSDGRPFIAGDAFTVADITGMATLRICAFAEQTVPDALTRVKAWEERVQARSSWNA